mmetsp:Transcript_29569/g.45088  ORF Transcript_29569/g.45088 Transcript_29569/m.45088 type:complete len:220 (+) Transcript_29569:672-1331(+)
MVQIPFSSFLEFNFAANLPLRAVFELRHDLNGLLDILGLFNVGEVLVFQVGEVVHELLRILVEDVLVVEVLVHVDQVLVQELLEPVLPVLVGHDLGHGLLLRLAFVKRILFEPEGHFFMELGVVDPLAALFVEATLALLFLLLSPHGVLLLENVKEEALVLFEGVQLVQVLVDIALDVLHAGVQLLDHSLLGFALVGLIVRFFVALGGRLVISLDELFQ